MNSIERRLYEDLVFLYGEDEAQISYTQITKLLENFRKEYPDFYQSETSRVNEEDVILITYADMVQEKGKSNLRSLSDFLTDHVKEVVSTVHILPFYPYSSDDGFAVIDYLEVNPSFGTWDDIDQLGQDFRLMFDAVINHISSKSPWFQAFVSGELPYRGYFTVIEPGTDLSMVFRPRSSPLLTPVETINGVELVWTTFSEDQMDLNYRNPYLLYEVIKVILFYTAHGAEFIRLDAVTFIWKELGTPCINLPETHRVIQLLRTVLDLVAPQVTIITETNVPHKENISYFGDGTNEAQMVYNFALPLLTIHAFLRGDAQILSEWASTLELPSKETTFFNFLAGHDGIGMLPVKNILSQSDIEMLVEQAEEKGGNVSYKSNSDGSLSPYELNINYLDMLATPGDGESLEKVRDRFLSSQAIMLSMRGVPGIYFHSLFGSRNWQEGVKQTGRFRTINREKFTRERLEKELADSESLRHNIFEGYCKLLRCRRSSSAFNPTGGQVILSLDPSIFAVFRTSPTNDSRVLCIHNVSDNEVRLDVDLPRELGVSVDHLINLLDNGENTIEDGHWRVTLSPYQTIWVSVES